MERANPFHSALGLTGLACVLVITLFIPKVPRLNPVVLAVMIVAAVIGTVYSMSFVIILVLVSLAAL